MSLTTKEGLHLIVSCDHLHGEDAYLTGYYTSIDIVLKIMERLYRYITVTSHLGYEIKSWLGCCLQYFMHVCVPLKTRQSDFKKRRFYL